MKVNWREVVGGSSLCGFVAAAGVQGGYFKTVEELLLAAAEIFRVRHESDCVKMSKSIAALSAAKRRRLCREHYTRHMNGTQLDPSIKSCRRLDKYIKNTEKKRRRLELRKSKPLVTPSHSPTQDQITEFYASWEWKQLSFATKVERGRQCECCGAKPPAVVIHTDHVKPLRHFWHLRLAKDNMQILCEDCNRGKGSWNQTDFRAELTTPPWTEAGVKVEWGDTWDDIPLNGYPN